MTPAEPGADVIFELRLGRAPEDARQAIRILGDGRAQLRGDALPRIDEAGRVQMDPAPLRWRDAWRYTAEELDRVRAVVAAAARGLQPRYAIPGGDRIGERLSWRLRSGERLVEVEVEGAPFATPAVLAELYPRLQRLHERAPERTVWRVWSAGAVVERHVDCDVSEVPALAALRNVLFNPDSAAPEEEPAGGEPPDGTPLVEVEFATARGRYVSRFYADGRRREERPEGPRELTDMSDAHIAAVRAAVARADVAALPEPVC